MTNADKFKETFGIYATELWAMPGADFPKWLSAESNTETRAKRREEIVEISEQELTRLKKHEESYYKLKKEKEDLYSALAPMFKQLFEDLDYNTVFMKLFIGE